MSGTCMCSLGKSAVATDPPSGALPQRVRSAIARGELSEDAARLVRATGIFAVAYRRMLEIDAAADGISVSRMRLLHLLHVGGSQIMSALRQQLGVTARNVTQLVDGLEGDALVRRVPHPADPPCHHDRDH